MTMKTITLITISTLTLVCMTPRTSGAEPGLLQESAITGSWSVEPCISEAAADNAPAPDDSSSSGSRDDHRWRLQVGGIGLVAGDLINVAVLPFINLNHRWSWNVEPHGAGPLVEVGVNYIIPYVKAGFELRASRFLFDLHGGGMLGVEVAGSSAPVMLLPLAGADIAYLFPVGSLRMEVETGMEYVATPDPTAFGHVTVGLVW